MTTFLSQAGIATITGTSPARVARAFAKSRVAADGELLRGALVAPSPLYKADRLAELADVHAALAELAADAEDRAIVLVEHNVDAALRFATRVLELDAAGRVVWDGAADSWPGTEGWVRSAAASPGRDMPPRSSVALPPDPMPARPGDAVSALGDMQDVSEMGLGPPLGDTTTLRSPRPTPAAASRRPEPPGRVGPAQGPRFT